MCVYIYTHTRIHTYTAKATKLGWSMPPTIIVIVNQHKDKPSSDSAQVSF